MGTAIDQKAYLQRYLSGPSNDKKKKKKKVVKGKGFKIIDDDLDLSKLRPLEGDELDVFGEGDDAPQIAGIIDERPEDVRKMEQFKTTTKWRVINQDDGFNSNLQIEEIKQDVKEAEKENELIFGKMYSDSEDEQKNGSDLSPPRKQTNKDTKKEAPKKPQNHSDDDFSPPRRKEDKKSKSNSKNYDSHLSPQRSKQKSESHPRTIYQNSDSDLSPPRKNETKKPNAKVRKPSRWGDFGKEERSRTSPDASPRRSKRDSRSPNRKRHKEKSSRRSDSDNSPPRKNQKDKNYDSDLSPPRKTQRNKNKNSDSDLSPPRKSKKDDVRKRNKSPDSDLSPPRKRKGSPDRHNSDKYNRNKMDDYRRKSDKQISNMSRNNQSSRDEFRRRSKDRDSRKRRDSDSDSTDRNKYNKRKYRNSDSPPPTNKKMDKTLDGKQAGLQNAMQLRQENEAFRMREEEAFGKMTDEFSGRNAKAVSRKAKRETSEDRQKQREKADRQKELDEKYRIWGKGLKQIQVQEQRVQEFIHEASKPLARHKDDKDLEHRLKDVEREGDPMLKYIREKKRDRGELGPEKPSYKGSFPPNRFNIRPGYRWDGVDRSNGYEKKYFDQQSKRKAQEEEAYKWSTEDL